MSKNNYSDLVSILEYLDKKNMDTKQQPKQRGYRRYRQDETKDDPILHVMQMKRSVDEWNKLMGDIEKINKKEEKKEEPKKKTWWEELHFVQKVAVLTATVPPVIMIQFLFVVAVIKISANLLGLR